MSENVGYSENFNRDITAVKWIDPVYVTHTDGQNAAIILDNSGYPHDYNINKRLIYKSYNNVETRTDYYSATGYYSTSYATQQRDNEFYWLESKGGKCVSWDLDKIYIKGASGNIVTYNDSYPHPQPHDFIICACLPKGALSQADYDTYKAINPSLDEMVINQPRVVVLLEKPSGDFELLVCTYRSSNFASLIYVDVCYRRTIDWFDLFNDNSYYNWIVGFKGDAKTLFYVLLDYPDDNNTEPTIDGLYKMVFSDDYITDTKTKIADTAFPKLTETSSISVVNGDPENPEMPFDQINASVSQTLLSNGLFIVDTFLHRDSLTVIYATLNQHTWTETFTQTHQGAKVVNGLFIVDTFLHRDSLTVIYATLNQHTWTETFTQTHQGAKVVNGSMDSVYQYKAYKLHADGNSLVDANRTLFYHKEQYTYTANDDYIDGDFEYNQTNIATAYDTEAHLFFANADKDIYIYRTDNATWDNSFYGNETDGIFIDYDYHRIDKLIVQKNGIETVIDSVNFDRVQTVASNVNQQIGGGWNNYYNGSGTYLASLLWWNPTKSYAFDDRTIITALALTANWDAFTPNPRSLIYDYASDNYTLLNYRIDYFYDSTPPTTGAVITPLTVTSYKRAG